MKPDNKVYKMTRSKSDAEDSFTVSSYIVGKNIEVCLCWKYDESKSLPRPKLSGCSKYKSKSEDYKISSTIFWRNSFRYYFAKVKENANCP